MFDFLHRWRRSSVSPHFDEAQHKLMVVTRDDDFFVVVHGAATGCGWEVRRAGTVELGVLDMEGFRASVAIYDWPASEEDWKNAVDRLASLPDRPCVLLASPVDDQYLDAEVARHGGFDVIPRSASPERIISAIEFAAFFRKNSLTTRGGRSFVR
jgi:hypothetical protein